jgi:hypothetical protein
LKYEFNIVVGERCAVDLVDPLRLLVFAEQLYGADTIASDRFQKVERFDRFCLKARGDAFANLRRVGQ